MAYEKIGNRVYNNTNYWDNHNIEIIANYYKLLAEHPEITIDELNNFLAQNHNLFIGSKYKPDSNKAILYTGVKDYLRKYHNYGFNTDKKSVFWKNDKAYSTDPLNTGDSYPEDWSNFLGDDYFGELTNRRRANFFNKEELDLANKAVASRGWHWELADYDKDDSRSEYQTNGRLFYKLVEDPKYNDVKYGKTKSIPKLPYSEIFKFIYLGYLNAATAYNQHAAASKLRRPLKEVVYPEYKVTNAFLTRLGLDKAKGEANWLATLGLSSDLDYNLKVRKYYQDKNSELDAKAAELKALEYATTTDLAEKVKLTRAGLWGENNWYNKQMIYADKADIVKNSLKLLETLNANMQSIINNAYQSHSLWTLQDRLNQLGRQRILDKMRQRKELAPLNEKYNKYLIDDYSEFDTYKQFKNAVLNGNFEGSEYDQKTGESLDDWVTRLWGMENDPEIQSYRNNLKLEKDKALEAYKKEYNELLNKWDLNELNYGTYVNGEGLRLLDNRNLYLPSGSVYRGNEIYVKPTYHYKSGGSINARLDRRTRFIEYLDLIQKLNLFKDKLTDKANERIEKRLAINLDNLSDAELLLLRSVFK